MCSGGNSKEEAGNVVSGYIGFQSLNFTSNVLKLLLPPKLKELLRCLGPITFWWGSEQIDLAYYFWIFQKDKKYSVIHIFGISISIIVRTSECNNEN